MGLGDKRPYVRHRRVKRLTSDSVSEKGSLRLHLLKTNVLDMFTEITVLRVSHRLKTQSDSSSTFKFYKVKINISLDN